VPFVITPVPPWATSNARDERRPCAAKAALW
jgi:hypothetical protein